MAGWQCALFFIGIAEFGFGGDKMQKGQSFLKALFVYVGVRRLHPPTANILLSIFYKEQVQRVHYLVLICFE